MSEARELLEQAAKDIYQRAARVEDDPSRTTMADRLIASIEARVMRNFSGALATALATEPGAVPELPEYVIWSNEHAAWWRAGCRGYATDLAEAGRYSREEALSICDQWVHFSVPREIPILFDDARILTTCERARRAGS